ncbi:TonB-dependent receptor, partial [Pseudomonas sp. FW306-02-F04-BA]|uniref:TonB-dependent receptor domain-containing protein n=1 Tax=Pseudomonas sp. FW306-02-F04-BA TaxID=2070655 RepID=UPI000CAB30F9
TDLFTWNATGEYHLDNVTMLYLTVSRGAKAFGYNIGFGNALPSQRPFKDEFVYNYEAGVKTSLFDGRARLAASVFRANYHNFQN